MKRQGPGLCFQTHKYFTMTFPHNQILCHLQWRCHCKFLCSVLVFNRSPVFRWADPGGREVGLPHSLPHLAFKCTVWFEPGSWRLTPGNRCCLPWEVSSTLRAEKHQSRPHSLPFFLVL
jgi:hypothetical protein